MDNKEFNECLDELLYYDLKRKDYRIWSSYLEKLIDYYNEFNRNYNHKNIKVNLDTENLDLYLIKGGFKSLVHSSEFERYLPTISELLEYIGEINDRDRSNSRSR